MSLSGLDAFKKRASSSFATFQTAGATVAGPITEISDQKQATKWNPDKNAKRELDFWPSGDPVMEVWITVQTQERNPQDEEDTGLRSIVITVNQKAGGQLAAIMDACEAAGVPAPAVGGFLALTFTGFDPESKNPQNPRKLYAAKYQAPAAGGGAFTQQAPPVQQQVPAQQYNQWNPAPAAPVEDPWATPGTQYAQPPVQQAPPAWATAPQATPPVQQYQPPVQVNTGTGEIAPQQQAPVPTPQPVYEQPPVAPVAGGWDATAVQNCLRQGMDDATIASTTGAPLQAIAAIRAAGPQ